MPLFPVTVALIDTHQTPQKMFRRSLLPGRALGDPILCICMRPACVVARVWSHCGQCTRQPLSIDFGRFHKFRHFSSFAIFGWCISRHNQATRLPSLECELDVHFLASVKFHWVGSSKVACDAGPSKSLILVLAIDRKSLSTLTNWTACYWSC